MGGQANLRPSWAAYYKATDAVIVVIDSTDRARVSIAKASTQLFHSLQVLQSTCCAGVAKCTSVRVQGELFRLLEHEHLANAVVLVLANKQDLRVRRLLVPTALVPTPMVTGTIGRLFCHCLCYTLI